MIDANPVKRTHSRRIISIIFIITLIIAAASWLAYRDSGREVQAAVDPGNDLKIGSTAPYPTNDIDPVDINGDPISRQQPLLVVGYDGKIGNGGTFYDPILELDLWVPDGEIGNLRITPYDVCNTSLDTNVSSNKYLTIYIKGENKEEKIIDGNVDCTKFSITKAELEGLAPLDEKLLSHKVPAAEYDKYRIIVRATSPPKSTPSGSHEVYINQFRLTATHPTESYLTIPESGDDNDLDVDDLGALNISNRRSGNNNRNSRWSATIYVAIDPKKGCGNKETKWIGLYDSDRTSSTLDIQISSADRNEYLNNPTSATFTPDKTLEFDGYINSNDGSKERDPERYRSGHEDRNTAVDPPNRRFNDYVGWNNWEDKEFIFSANKIYKLRIDNVASQNWIQVRLPFDQFNALLPCGRKPLIKAYYGDVSAGGIFGLGDNLKACIAQDLSSVKAGIYAHASSGDPQNTPFYASSAQYGVRANGPIEGFYSSFPAPPRSPPGSRTRLTFANNDLSNYKWGGNFSTQGRCMPNYWRRAVSLTASTGNSLDISVRAQISSNDEKLYLASPFEVINSRPDDDMKLKTTVYVDGDLKIKNNILNNTSRGSPTNFELLNEIGHIYFVVKGDIFIDPSVTQIDAVLVAYSENNSSSGRIFTCDFQAGNNNIDLLGDPSTSVGVAIRQTSQAYDSACNKKLTINGALIAREVRLGRVYCKTLVITPACPAPSTDNVAEEINLLPEYFLGAPQLPDHGEWLYKSDSSTILPSNV